MQNTTGTVFRWYVERNGDPHTRRSFTSESLAQEYANMFDRVSDDQTTTRIYCAPTIEMVEIAKSVGEEHVLQGVYAVIAEPSNKYPVSRKTKRNWVPATVVSVLVAMFAIYGFGVTIAPPREEPLPITITCPVSKADLVFLPGGTVFMGTSEEDRKYILESQDLSVWNIRRVKSERQHLATVGSFYIATTEVTVRQFRKFVTATRYTTTVETDTTTDGIGVIDNKWKYIPGCYFDNLGELTTDRMPAINISYRDAHAYCEWLSEQTGHRYRLPTEAEWEYAARAGTSTRWYTGNDLLTASQSGWLNNTKVNGPKPVAQFDPNPFGLYDMIGNAWEWCDDHFDDNRPWRVLKGGSFFSKPFMARSASRSGQKETHIGANGFRIVREVRKVPKVARN